MLSELSIMSKMCMMGKLGMLSMMSTMSMMNTLSTLDMMSMHEHYEHDEHDESALSSLAEHHEHDEHAEHAVVGCIPAIAFRSIDSMNGIPAILCLVGLVSCIRCVLYRVSTCTRNTIAQSPMLTSYKQTHSAAIHVHRRSARVIRLQACNDLTKTARCGVLDVQRGHCVVPNLEPNHARTRTLLRLARAFTYVRSPCVPHVDL